jgi:GxxExxY protein
MTPKKLAPDFIFKEECYAIIGACFEVYKDKGCGFYDPVYQECLGIEFDYCRIPAIAQPGLSLQYRSRILNQKYFPDFVCYDKIIVELKALTELTDEHRAQVLNYLKAGRFELGFSSTLAITPNCNTSALQKHVPNRIPMNRSPSKAWASLACLADNSYDELRHLIRVSRA